MPALPPRTRPSISFQVSAAPFALLNIESDTLKGRIPHLASVGGTVATYEPGEVDTAKEERLNAGVIHHVKPPVDVQHVKHRRT